MPELIPAAPGLLLDCDNCGCAKFYVFYHEDTSRYQLSCAACGYEFAVRAGA